MTGQWRVVCSRRLWRNRCRARVSQCSTPFCTLQLQNRAAIKQHNRKAGHWKSLSLSNNSQTLRPLQSGLVKQGWSRYQGTGPSGRAISAEEVGIEDPVLVGRLETGLLDEAGGNGVS